MEGTKSLDRFNQEFFLYPMFIMYIPFSAVHRKQLYFALITAILVG